MNFSDVPQMSAPLLVNKFICFSSRVAQAISSASMRAIQNPRAISIPLLRAAAKPRFSVRYITILLSSFASFARMSYELSVDPSSMQINSKSEKVWLVMDFIALDKNTSPL